MVSSESDLADNPQEREDDDNPETSLLEVEQNEEEMSTLNTPFANDLPLCDAYGAIPSDEEETTSEQMIQRETLNVIQLGIGLSFLFSAALTQGFTVQPVLSSRHEEDPRFSEYAGYYSSTVSLISYTIANLFSAPFVMLVGPKWSLVLSSAGYTVHMLGFLFLNPYFLYFTSTLQGICAAVVWTAVGLLLARNSTEKNISRNSGIMWMLFMISMVIGGVFLLIMFSSNNEQKISVALTRQIYTGFSCFCICGGITFALMRTTPYAVSEKTNTWMEMKKSLSLMATFDMSLLFPLFLFVGFEAGLYSGVYSTALAYTNAFHMNTNVLMALNSIAVGAGQIIAGLPLIILGERASRRGVFPLILIASIAGLLAFSLVFINIPGNASYEQTDDIAFINPSIAVALMAGFLMGVCDSFANTGFYSFVSVRYEQESAQVNSVMKFVSALPNIAVVYLGSLLELYWQLLIASVFAVLAFIAFVFAERRSKKFKLVGP